MACALWQTPELISWQHSTLSVHSELLKHGLHFGSGFGVGAGGVGDGLGAQPAAAPPEHPAAGLHAFAQPGDLGLLIASKSQQHPTPVAWLHISCQLSQGLSGTLRSPAQHVALPSFGIDVADWHTSLPSTIPLPQQSPGLGAPQ